METLGVELLKFGETCKMAIPSQAWKQEGVETRRAAPKARCYGEGIVQTTNASCGDESRSWYENLLLRLAGSSPAAPTTRNRHDNNC